MPGIEKVIAYSVPIIHAWASLCPFRQLGHYGNYNEAMKVNGTVKRLCLLQTNSLRGCRLDSSGKNSRGFSSQSKILFFNF